MKLDLDHLTLNETRILCKKLERPMDKLDESDPLDLMQAMAWIVGKRTNPGLTYEQAGDMPISDFEIEVEDVPLGRSEKTGRKR